MTVSTQCVCFLHEKRETYRSGPLLSGTDTLALYCRDRATEKSISVNHVRCPIGVARHHEVWCQEGVTPKDKQAREE